MIKASDMFKFIWTAGPFFMACNDAAAKQTACIRSTAAIVIILLYLPLRVPA